MQLVEEKIQVIAKEIQEANANQWTVTKIVKALNELNTGSEKKLREKALELLKELDPNAAVIYERFSKMKVYTSSETIRGFNRGNIVNSLLKETNISRTAAEKITLEVENQVKDAKIVFLTPSLIRELVNAKLIAYGFEEVRNNYARVGEPVFEVKKKIEAGPYSGETAREYNILLEVPREARELHYDGTIHIEDTAGFSFRPYAYSIISEKKESIEETICDSIKQVAHNKKYFYLPPSLYGLTFACAGFVKTNKQAENAAELIKTASGILEEKPLLSLELFTPSKLEGLGAHRLEAAKISNCLLNENVVVGVDSKYSLKLIEPEGKQFMILNNSGEEYYPLSKKLFSPTRGINLFINLNLEKMVDGEDEKIFFEKLNHVADTIKHLCEKKKEDLQKKAYLKQFPLEEMKTGIGLTNLFKLSENFSTKPVEFSNKVFKELTELFEDYLLFGLASEEAQKRFTKAVGKEIFSQETLAFEECLTSKKCCFTGKAGTIKELNELLDKKVKQVEYVGL
jgi:hypothetical protein